MQSKRLSSQSLTLIISLVVFLSVEGSFGMQTGSRAQRLRLTTPDTPDVLKGLKGVYVLVEGIAQDATQDGLRTIDLRTDTELKLRTAGIRVLSHDEVRKESGRPTL